MNTGVVNRRRSRAIVATLLLIVMAMPGELSAQSISPPERPINSIHDLISLESEMPVSTVELLRVLKWDSLMTACNDRAASPHCDADTMHDKGLVYYYHSYGNSIDHIDFATHRDIVVRFTVFLEDTLVGRYFNKAAWLRYVYDRPGFQANSHRISDDEPKWILVAYYRLMGAGTAYYYATRPPYEYGWSCECCDEPYVHDLRHAAIELINARRSDLLRQVLRGPSPVGRVYAVDALIYLDHLTRASLEECRQRRAACMQELASHPLSPERNQEAIDALNQEQKQLEKDLLTMDDRIIIEEIRASDIMIETCGNDLEPVREVLSDSAIARIPEEYEHLRKAGYFQE